ncbi:MAG: hypothetical protein ACI8WT_001919 [Clostridium sp.]|jgi:hypothetical protein
MFFIIFYRKILKTKTSPKNERLWYFLKNKTRAFIYALVDEQYRNMVQQSNRKKYYILYKLYVGIL